MFGTILLNVMMACIVWRFAIQPILMDTMWWKHRRALANARHQAELKEAKLAHESRMRILREVNSDSPLE